MSYHSVLFFQPLTLQVMLPTKGMFLPPLPLVVSFPHSLRLSVISDLPSFPFLSRLVHAIPFLSESELRIYSLVRSILLDLRPRPIHCPRQKISWVHMYKMVQYVQFARDLDLSIFMGPFLLLFGPCIPIFVYPICSYREINRREGLDSVFIPFAVVPFA